MAIEVSSLLNSARQIQKSNEKGPTAAPKRSNNTSNETGQIARDEISTQLRNQVRNHIQELKSLQSNISKEQLKAGYLENIAQEITQNNSNPQQAFNITELENATWENERIFDSSLLNEINNKNADLVNKELANINREIEKNINNIKSRQVELQNILSANSTEQNQNIDFQNLRQEILNDNQYTANIINVDPQNLEKLL
jgi:hypothetical protein